MSLKHNVIRRTQPIQIREAKEEDLGEWARMRVELWPDSVQTHIEEIRLYFSGASIDIVQAFVLENARGSLCGFMELNIRNFAEGSRSPKLPYVEAWFVDKDYRGRGHGKRLMSVAEKWAVDQGYSALASDTEVDNEGSIAIHKTLGFKETERIVCFLKKLT